MYQKNGVPYTHTDLKRDNPNVGFPRKALENPDIRTEYGIVEIETPKSELPPTNIQPVEPTTPDGFWAKRGDPELVGDEWRETWNYVEMTWLENRTEAYGYPREQIEFITENGLEAWQAKVAEIKAKYPKA
tara:strand:+ start:313 stop:705 length:393 start_codon:yes stop_codon:yes gene_type:complete